MEYRQLGNTDIKVSVICLGTMTWGEQNTQQEAHEQLDYALSQGVNFIDTAEMYPVPPKAETYTATETIIGNWLKSRTDRDKIVLATKVVGRSESSPYIRDGHPVLDRKNIEQALNESLKRLQTDYIDLYQLHWPDRNTNYFGQLGYQHAVNEESIAIEETLAALADLVKAGKIRHIGISNETPWGMMRFAELARDGKLPRVVSIQNPYNLLNRTFEIGCAEVAHREQIGLLAYSPLGFGMLSGKYLNHSRPVNARLTLFTRFTRYSNPQALAATEEYVSLARREDLDPAQMALAYVNSRSFLTSNIIGATTMQQLKTDIDSINLKLSDRVLQEIERIHVQQPNPSP